ncbi:hypothetical protein Ciccas_009257 [Cichlidogyrus casuarinus]|uniref:Protein polybromo-1 n=1 Tax=Cichlidogyrus casuarinus TaxID=1844966 RepID=A0ABD2PYY8_9PLAT
MVQDNILFTRHIDTITTGALRRWWQMTKRGSSASSDESSTPKKRVKNIYWDILNRLRKEENHFDKELDIIEEKVKANEYTSTDELANDVHQIVGEAKSLHEPTSLEFGYACTLGEALHRIRSELQPLSEVSNTSTRSGRSRSAKEDISDTESNNSSSTATDTLLAAYFSLIVNYRTDEGKIVSATFKVLPSRSVYPQYYQVIKEPVDLRLIAQNIVNGRYESLDEMEKDLNLMVKNARAFNEPKSDIYQDALALQRVIKTKKQEAELTPKRTRGSSRRGSSLPPQDLCEEYANLKSPQAADFAIPVDEDDDEDELSSQEGEEEEGISVDDDASSCSTLTPARLKATMGSPKWAMLKLIERVTQQENSSNFLRLPSRKVYPDYYEDIKEPVCLYMIKRKIKNNEYDSVQHCFEDVQLMCRNAFEYNVEESQIYKDAQNIMSVALETFADLKKNHPNSLNSVQKSAPSSPSSIGAGGTSRKMSLAGPHKGRIKLSEDELRLRRMTSLFNHMNQHEEENGHHPQPSFRELPSRDKYPEFYAQVRNPISMTMIEEKWQSNGYTKYEEMSVDFSSMLNDFKAVFPSESQYHRDACILESVLKKRLRAMQADKRREERKQQKQSVAVAKCGEQLLMAQVFQAIREYKATDRVLSDPFWRLPAKEDLPEYYKYIRKPVEMSAIGVNILTNAYENFDACLDDLFLMFDNACKFNEPSSQIYADSVLLHCVALKKRDRLLPAETMSQCEVQHSFRKMITHLHNALLTACDPDGRGYVDSLIAGDGTETAATSPTAVRLEALHKAVAHSAYTRMDHFQHDWLQVLQRARTGEVDSPATLQQRLDAIELVRLHNVDSATSRIRVRRWIKVRDEAFAKVSSVAPPDSETAFQSLTREYQCITRANHNFTLPDLEKQLAREAHDYPIKRFTDDVAEGTVATLLDGQTVVETLPLSADSSLHQGEFIYFGEERRIGRVVRMALAGSDPHGASIFVAIYYTPTEAKPSRRRRLLPNEIFRTGSIEHIKLQQVKGKCVVTTVGQLSRSTPSNFNSKDVYVCETHYSVQGHLFTKINHECPLAASVGVQWESKSTPKLPTRLPPQEPLPNVLAQVCKNKYDFMEFPSRREFANVATQNEDDKELFDQMQHKASFVKVGDCVYLDGTGDIVRVDKIWRLNGEVKFSGAKFVKPASVEHMPTRLFMPREIYMSDAPHEVYELQTVKAKCHIMRPADFVMARPIEFKDEDVYVCNSKYFEKEKVIRRLKTGLKRFQLDALSEQDEYLIIPYTPLRKEGSPATHCPGPIDEFYLNLPPENAIPFVHNVCADFLKNNPVNKNLFGLLPSKAPLSPIPVPEPVALPPPVSTESSTKKSLSIQAWDDDDELERGELRRGSSLSIRWSETFAGPPGPSEGRTTPNTQTAASDLCFS